MTFDAAGEKDTLRAIEDEQGLRPQLDMDYLRAETEALTRSWARHSKKAQAFALKDGKRRPKRLPIRPWRRSFTT